MVFIAVIDTNVLVSALLTRHEDASPLRIIRHLFCGNIVSLYNDEILQEYEDVLRRPKFRFSEDAIAALLHAIKAHGMSIERAHTNMQLIDPKDLVFYEVAMAKQDEHARLVTGNKKHFPSEPLIVTPTEMLEIMSRS